MRRVGRGDHDRHPRCRPRERLLRVGVSTLADDGDETQTGFGFSVGRSPDEFDLDKAAREAVDRATRLLGATQAAEPSG